jgi:5-hydroxyisourate hydrolase-like protein (transthyretin family)
MKLLNNKFAVAVLLTGCLANHNAFAQPAAKGRLSVTVSYFAINDKVPYLLAKAKTKANGRFKPVGGVTLKLFLNNDSAANLIKEVVTDEKGEASALIPPSLKAGWDRSAKRNFLVTFRGDSNYEAAEGDLTVGRAKIVVDTAEGRKVVATVLEWKDTGWAPVKGVDLSIAIKRLNAYLNVNQTATFTTDSTGTARADFKRDSIPGDADGNIVITAKVDDNDSYGNLQQELTVAWGTKFAGTNTFAERTLFATRDKAPIWLLLMAYSIVACVWGTLVFLVVNLFRIKKAGKELPRAIL